MRFGLSEEIIKKINTVFAAFPAIEHVVLYGSRAKGNYKHGSDIDLTMKGEKLTYSMLNEGSIALDDLLLPYTFDLSLWDHFSDPDLLKHIQRAGKIFYTKMSDTPVSRVDLIRSR
ncbi:MAG: nucleotidyltransferase domain-containing protein [Chitinophagaceae bacterium]